MSGNEDVIEEVEDDEESLFIGRREEYGLEPFETGSSKEPLDPFMEEEIYDEDKLDADVERCTRKPRPERRYIMHLRFRGVTKFTQFTKPIEPLPDYEDEEEELKEGEIQEAEDENMEDLADRLRNVTMEKSGSKKRSFDDDYEDGRAKKKANTSAVASSLADKFLSSLESEILAKNAVESAAPTTAELEAQNSALMASLELSRGDLLRIQDELQNERNARSRDNQLLNDRLQRIGLLEGQVRAFESDAVSKKWEIDTLAKSHSSDTQALEAAQNDLQLEKEKYKSSAAENSRLLKEIDKAAKEATDERDLMQANLKNLHEKSQQEIEKRDQAKIKADEEAFKAAQNARVQGAQANIDAAITQHQVEHITNERDAAMRERDQILRDIECMINLPIIDDILANVSTDYLAQAGNNAHSNGIDLQLSNLYGHIQSSLISNYESRYKEVADNFSEQRATMIRENALLNSLLSEAETIIGQLEQEKTGLDLSYSKAERTAKESGLQCERHMAEHQDLRARFDELFNENQRMKTEMESQSQQQEPIKDPESFSDDIASLERESESEPIIHDDECLETESSLHQKLAESEQRLAKIEKELVEVKKEKANIQNAAAQKLNKNPAECDGCRCLRGEIEARNQELAARNIMIKELKQSAKDLSARALQKAVLADFLEQKLNASQKQARMDRLEREIREAKKSASKSDRELVKQKELNQELQVELKQLSDENKRLMRLPETKLLVAEEGKAKYAENQEILDIAQKMLGNATSAISRSKKSELYMKQLLREAMEEERHSHSTSRSSEYTSLHTLWQGRIDTLENLLTPEQKLHGHATDFGCLEKHSQSLIPSPELVIANTSDIEKPKFVSKDLISEDLALAVVVYTGGETKSGDNACDEEGPGEGTSKELTMLPAEHMPVTEALIDDHAAPADIPSTSGFADLDADVKYLESPDPASEDKISTSRDSPTSANDKLLKLVQQKLEYYDFEREQERALHMEMVDRLGVEIDGFLSLAASAKNAVDSVNTVHKQNAKLKRMVKKERRNAHNSWIAILVTYFMLILYLMRASIGSAFSTWMKPTLVKVNLSLNNEQNEFCFAEYFLHNNTTNLIDTTTLNGVCYGQDARVFINKTVTVTVLAAKLEPSTPAAAEHAVVDFNTLPDNHRQYGLFETPLSEFNTTRVARILNAALYFGSMGVTAVGGWKAYRALHR